MNVEFWNIFSIKNSFVLIDIHAHVNLSAMPYFRHTRPVSAACIELKSSLIVAHLQLKVHADYAITQILAILYQHKL